MVKTCSRSKARSCSPRPRHTANDGRTPKCWATQCLQVGACYLCHRSGSDQLIPTSPGIFWGETGLLPPTAGSGKTQASALLGAPRTDMGNPPGTCKSTFHAWGVSKGHTGCQGLPWSLWPSIMCFDNCRQACSLRDSAQGAFQTKTLPNNTPTYSEDPADAGSWSGQTQPLTSAALQSSFPGRQRPPPGCTLLFLN